MQSMIITKNLISLKDIKKIIMIIDLSFLPPLNLIVKMIIMIIILLLHCFHYSYRRIMIIIVAIRGK